MLPFLTPSGCVDRAGGDAPSEPLVCGWVFFGHCRSMLMLVGEHRVSDQSAVLGVNGTPAAWWSGCEIALLSFLCVWFQDDLKKK